MLAVWSKFVSQKLVFFISATSRDNLACLKELIEAGKVTPAIDRRYTLSEVPEALRYLGEGHAQGKVIITLGHNGKP
jgi:NADPH:quinone reductase-like Zn-dependent oxidoreductase